MSPCCESGVWHQHNRHEWHLECDGFHLVAWHNPTSIGWEMRHRSNVYEGEAQDILQAKQRAYLAMVAYQTLRGELTKLGAKNA